VAAQHGELVAKDQDFQVLGGVASSQQRERLLGPAQRQIGSFDNIRAASETRPHLLNWADTTIGAKSHYGTVTRRDQ
jgi:hypothetical protein